MLLRVISYEKTGEKTSKMHQSLYEFERISFGPGDKLDENGEATEVIFVMERPDIKLTVQKAGRRAYIMNNDGKTIDSFNW